GRNSRDHPGREARIIGRGKGVRDGGRGTGVDGVYAAVSRRVFVHRHHQRPCETAAAPQGGTRQRIHALAPAGAPRLPREPGGSRGGAAARGRLAPPVPCRQARAGAALPMTPMTPQTIDRRDLLALVGALLVAAVCVRLGLWQLDRLHQRRAHNALVAAARARPELEIRDGPPLPIDSLRDRRLRARGAYDYARERLWHGRSYEGIPGVDFVTPLRLSDGTAVLVDRGRAPSPDGYHVDQQAYREGDSADVHGLGLAAPRGRGDVDPAALRDSLPYRVLPIVMQALP